MRGAHDAEIVACASLLIDSIVKQPWKIARVV
jgi:hypothetical protein